MIKKYTLITGIFLIIIALPSIVKADDNIYIKSDNIIKINNDFKIINTDNIISDILIDENNIYYFSDKNLYSINKNNGSINFKVYIIGINNFTQSDKYIFVNTNSKILKVNKLSGVIESSQFESIIDNIYSFFNPELQSNFEINNNDLCSYNHTINDCDGIRKSGIKYYTNNSDIELFVFSHANVNNQNAHITLNINNSNVSHTALRPLLVSENTYSQITALIPKNSNYTIYFENYHHYEWREYNLTFGVNEVTNYNNYTNISGSSIHNNLSGLQGGLLNDFYHLSLQSYNNIILIPDCSGLATFYNVISYFGNGFSCVTIPKITNGSIQINESQVNNLTNDLNSKINKSGDNMTGILNMTKNIIDNVRNIRLADTGGTNVTGFVQAVNFGDVISALNFANNRVYNLTSFQWEKTGYLTADRGQVFSLFGNDFVYINFNETDASTGVRQFEYQYNNVGNGMDIFLHHSNVSIDQNSTLTISSNGKGITMYAPNGLPFCTTVNNLGILITISGVCT